MASFEKVQDGWRAHVRRVGFKSTSRTFPTKAAAEDWATRTEAAMFNREHVHRVRVTDTVKDVLERFRDEVAPTRKGHRWEVVRINNYLASADFVHRRLDQLKPIDIKAWRDARLQEISPASVNREWNLLSGIFKYAIKEWDAPLRENPMHLAQRPKGKGRERTRRWAQEDLDKLLATCAWDPSKKPAVGRDYVPWAVLLGIETAMRLGELCALKVEDVRTEDRYVILHDSKNGDPRTVPLTKQAQHLFTCLVEGRKPSDPVFPLSSESLGLYFREKRNQAGLVDIRFHDTRHEAATRLSKKFTNVLQLSAVTGHRSLQSLKRYFNPTAAELVAKLDT
jgi:integrase